MLSKNLEKTLRRALALANARQHEYATIEHLLMALLDDEDAAPVLKACGGDIDRLRETLGEFLDHELSSLETDGVVDAKPTAGFQRIVQRAAIHVQTAGRSEINGANVLVALFSERESHAVYFLAEQGLTRLAAVNFISHGIAVPRGHGSSKAAPDLSSMIDAAEVQIPSGITFKADTVGEQASLEEVLDVLNVLRLDVNWAWRISEVISRIAAGSRRPYWIDQTIEDLTSLNKREQHAGMRINSLEFDPLDETVLSRPLILFIRAQKVNPLEVTIAVTAGSLTVVLIATMWALRTWKRASSEEDLVRAKIELFRHISAQITCKNVKQAKEIESLLLGVLNCPGGLHERGEEILLSVPHLLKARFGTSVTTTDTD